MVAPMKLGDWLVREGIKRKEFAAEIGISTAMVSDLCNGHVWPGHDFAWYIMRRTKGEVSANDFLAAKPKKRRAA